MSLSTYILYFCLTAFGYALTPSSGPFGSVKAMQRSICDHAGKSASVTYLPGVGHAVCLPSNSNLLTHSLANPAPLILLASGSATIAGSRRQNDMGYHLGAKWITRT